MCFAVGLISLLSVISVIWLLLGFKFCVCVIGYCFCCCCCPKCVIITNYNDMTVHLFFPNCLLVDYICIFVCVLSPEIAL